MKYQLRRKNVEVCYNINILVFKEIIKCYKYHYWTSSRTKEITWFNLLRARDDIFVLLPSSNHFVSKSKIIQATNETLSYILYHTNFLIFNLSNNVWDINEFPTHNILMISRKQTCKLFFTMLSWRVSGFRFPRKKVRSTSIYSVCPAACTSPSRLPSIFKTPFLKFK